MGACCGAEVYDDPENPAGDKTQKILFLGTGGCGKSTLFRQLRRKYGKGFTNKQRTDAIRGISGFVIETMQNILTDHESDEEKAALLNTLPHEEAVRAAQYVIAADPSKTSLQTKQMTEAIRTLWAVDAIKTRFHETAKVRINTACEHFFDSLDRISDPDYVPTDTDILMQRRPTTGLIEETIDLDAADKKTRFMMVDVGGQRNERKKWIHQFENVAAVVYVVSLSSFDEPLYEDETANSMQDALSCFRDTMTSDSVWFKQSALFLVFNKMDLFREKIATQSLSKCFDADVYDEEEMWTAISDDAQREAENREFIEKRFLEQMKSDGKQVQTFETCAYKEEEVKRVFDVILERIVRKNMTEP